MTVLVDTNASPPGCDPDFRSMSNTPSIWSASGWPLRPKRSLKPVTARLKAGWGAPRLGRLDRLIRRARTLPVDIETIDRVARLRNDCRLAGHPLHQKQHNGDLWVAATAIRWGIPLVAHDGVFLGCPGLDLRTEIQAGP